MRVKTAEKLAIHWFRRDLRLFDNHALFEALKSGNPVLPVFIFDTEILSKLADKDDRRVDFLHRTLSGLKTQLEKQGSSLLVKYGKPENVWRELLKQFDITTVYTNHDHEPYANERDARIEKILAENGIGFEHFKDISIFEREEVTKDDGLPYTVFTPYSKKWKAHFDPSMLAGYASEKHADSFVECDRFAMPSLEDMGFVSSDLQAPATQVPVGILKNYHETRDFPAIAGTSRLSVHLRFGTISPRQLTAKALKHNGTYLNELIWREFYMMILWNFPHAATGAFRPKYEEIQWEVNEEHFQAWCEGKTGYPMVDAGMRELNATGHMHNRVRMVVASFLTKHLLLDWRWGEAYFARKLLDFELSSNNGGWQWASGSGCDAVPYFRVFNPELQLKKFDPDRKYVRHWLPEWGTDSYPEPIIEHKYARNRAIERYAAVLKKSKGSTNSGQKVLF